jgi:hypothetical protein
LRFPKLAVSFRQDNPECNSHVENECAALQKKTNDHENWTLQHGQQAAARLE